MSWNQTSVSKNQTEKSRSISPVVITLLLALGVIVAISVVLFHRDEKKSERTPHSHSAKIKDVQPVKVHVSTFKTNTVPVVDKTLPDPMYARQNPMLPPKKYIPSIEEVEKARLGSDGKPRKISIYKSSFEQTLGRLFSTPLGSRQPMMPNLAPMLSRGELESFLNREFVYDKDQPQSVNENRILMHQVKDELKKYLEDGGKAEKFVSYYQGELQAAFEEWKTAQTMLMEMRRSGESDETLCSFRDKANELLSARGIKPIVIPNNNH